MNSRSLAHDFDHAFVSEIKRLNPGTLMPLTMKLTSAVSKGIFSAAGKEALGNAFNQDS